MVIITVLIVVAGFLLKYLYLNIVFKMRASLIVQLVKNLTAMQKTLVQFLGQEDPLEKGSATHSSILGLPWWLAGKESSCNVLMLASDFR